MAATASTMLELGTPAPDFDLPDATSPGMSRRIRLADYVDRPALLVMFICNHCPFVKHVRGELAKIAREYEPRGLGVVAISSNDAERYPADSPELMAREAAEAGYTFPYLYDESQNVARAYHAACTPDFFLFDRVRGLVYRGQLDDARPKNEKPVTGRDLRAAIEAVLDGEPVTGQQLPSIGCNIKWRPGNEPGYAR